MRLSISCAASCAALCLTLLAPSAPAQIAPEEISLATMPAPGSNWFISKTGNGGYIFDASTGEMQGLLSLSRSTPALAVYEPRQEFYAAESYYSRGVHGVRTDVVTIYDFLNLSPIAEVEIPNHMARLSVRGHLGLMNNGRYLAVFNMNPGQSVSIVDVENRRFVDEISTPGCAVIMPVANSDFLMLCGDGSLQLLQLDDSGNESNRVRSSSFFDVQEDPVFDRPTATADGWLLVTHKGQAFNVSTDDDTINISDSWSIVTEEDAGWRPGGGHFKSVQKELGLVYLLMHQGDDYTHHEPGTEIWVVDINSQRRLHRIELEDSSASLMVTQESQPKLLVAGAGVTHVYDALSFAHERTIEAPGAEMFEDF